MGHVAGYFCEHASLFTSVGASVGYVRVGHAGSLLLFGTLRLVTSELKTTVDYFSVHLCWLVLCVGMVTSGHPAGYFRVCLVSLLLEPVVYVYGHDSWLLL